jgi:integrase
MNDDARLPIDTTETCDAWFERYNAHQLALGQYGTRSQWRTWISPCIGSKRWIDVTSDDVEDLRDALDAAILGWRDRGRGRGRISGRTAMNVWWALRGATREAISSKRRDLRVLSGRLNPCAAVLPPGDKDSRQDRRKTFIYPSEFARLAACAAIPLAWREAHAIAVFTYLRPSELRALRWSDVDVLHGRMRVARAWSYLDRRIKPPKTRSGIRDVPIHPRLLPLLTRMRGTAGPGSAELVVPVLATVPTDTLAAHTRRHLLAAGVIRDELHVSTLSMVRANFRSWRDSGITWLAMDGVETAKIMRRAGHADIGTTMRYVKLAEDLGGELGEPFGALPEELTAAA